MPAAANLARCHVSMKKPRLSANTRGSTKSTSGIFVGVVFTRSQEPLLEHVDQIPPVRRFGPVPRELSDQLSVMESAKLRVTQDLIENSNDRAAFWPAYHRLRDALVEAKVLGARQLLLKLILRKFGSDVSQYENVIARCDVRTLNQCFERLGTASSLEEVLGPSLAELAGG